MIHNVTFDDEIKFYGQLPHVGWSRVIGLRPDSIEIQLYSGEHRWIKRHHIESSRTPNGTVTDQDRREAIRSLWSDISYCANANSHLGTGDQIREAAECLAVLGVSTEDLIQVLGEDNMDVRLYLRGDER